MNRKMVSNASGQLLGPCEVQADGSEGQQLGDIHEVGGQGCPRIPVDVSRGGIRGVRGSAWQARYPIDSKKSYAYTVVLRPDLSRSFT